MKDSEEELQNRIEHSEPADGLDARAYRQVFHALGKEPEYQLPSDFAEQVAGKISIRKERRFSSEYIWFAAGILSLAVAFVATLSLTPFRLDFGFLNRMADYKGLVVFAAGFILLLNWVDKKLVSDKQPHHKF